MSGFIYIMSNPTFKDGLIKIGMSDRDPTKYRKSELETTGVPDKFHVEYYAFVSDHYTLERKVHRNLDSSRPNKKREFFQYPIPNAIDLIRQLAGSSIEYEKVYYKSPEEIEKIRLERERVERNVEQQRIQKESELTEKRNLDAKNRKSQDISIKLSDVKDDLMELSEAEKGYVFWFIVDWTIAPLISLILPPVSLIIWVVALWHWFSWRKEASIRYDRILPIAEDEVQQLHGRLMFEVDWVESYDTHLKYTMGNFKYRVQRMSLNKDNTEVGNYFYDNKVNKTEISAQNIRAKNPEVLSLLSSISANKKIIRKLKLQRTMIIENDESKKFEDNNSSLGSLESVKLEIKKNELEIKRKRELIRSAKSNQS